MPDKTQFLMSLTPEWIPDPWRGPVATLTFLATVYAIGWGVYLLVFAALKRWSKSTSTDIDDAIVKYGRRPLRWVVPLSALAFAMPHLVLPPMLKSVLADMHSSVLILSFAWLALAGIRMAEAVIRARYDVTAEDNLRARAVHTQIRAIRNVASFLVVVVSIALLLMSFEQVRQLGVSLLASAGVAGIVIGFAAQKSISTVLAGIQIAFTQPIRIEDVVIVEGQWGRIEEITLTYVVVRIWDLRRLVVPINQFIEKPFENWTRQSADILGTVSIHADYSVPVEEVRQQLKKILDDADEWDEKVWNLQVVSASDKAMELRALMSSADASQNWTLRCKVREQLIAWLQEHHPESLPRLRSETPVLASAA